MLSTAIMTIPQRLLDAYKIAEKTGGQIIMDDGAKSPIITAMRAWGHGIVMNCKWHLVLEDDIELCDNFIDHVYVILNSINNDIHGVSFSCITGEVWKHYKPGINYIVNNIFAGGQAIAIRSYYVAELLLTFKSLIDQGIHQGDYGITTAFLSNNLNMAFTYPQLAQHKNESSFSGCDELVGKDKRKCPDYRKHINIEWKMTKENTVYVKNNYTKEEVLKIRKRMKEKRNAL